LKFKVTRQVGNNLQIVQIIDADILEFLKQNLTFKILENSLSNEYKDHIVYSEFIDVQQIARKNQVDGEEQEKYETKTYLFQIPASFFSRFFEKVDEAFQPAGDKY
jgi:hypothetical protein